VAPAVAGPRRARSRGQQSAPRFEDLAAARPPRPVPSVRRSLGGNSVKFGIFYEHQLPRPWEADDEHQLLKNALDQVELADRLGIDYVWEVEHHFLEEYSHSSAPEIFLAAASQRTS